MVNYKNIITDNLFDLYSYVGAGCNLSIQQNKAYSYVKNEDAPWPNFIFNEHGSEDNLDQMLSGISAGIETGKLPPFWISLSDSYLSKEEQTLDKYRIRKVMQWPGMLMVGRALETSGDKNLELVRVESIQQIEIWSKMVADNLFGKRTFNVDFLVKLNALDNISLFLGRYKGNWVSTAMTFRSKQVVGIFMISTSQEYRKQGFGKEITVRAAKQAADEDTAYIVLEANRESKHMYESIGFREYCNFDIYWKLAY